MTAGKEISKLAQNEATAIRKKLSFSPFTWFEPYPRSLK